MGDQPISRAVLLALGGRAAQLATPLTNGFRRLGFAVTIVTDDTKADDDVQGKTVRIVDAGSRLQWARALDETSTATPFHFLVHCLLPSRDVAAGAMSSLPLERWHALTKVPLTATLRMLQAISTSFLSRPLAIVGLGPSFALTGATDCAPLVAALEGQRALFKSVARQWGDRGITLNWVFAAPESMSPVFDEVQPPRRPDAGAVALGRRPCLENEICATLAAFAGEAGRHLTGTTINADGGEWMVP